MWYYYITELHAYNFVIKGFVIKRGVISAGPCICRYCLKKHIFIGFKAEIRQKQVYIWNFYTILSSISLLVWLICMCMPVCACGLFSD